MAREPEPLPYWENLLRGGALGSNLGDRLVEAAEQLLGEPIDERFAHLDLATNDAGFDPFGFDPAVARYALAVMALAHRYYFRLQATGLENVVHGRCLIVANHSGQIPVDGALLAASMLMDVDPPILVRGMIERWTTQLPFLSVLFPRIGQVLGTPENARWLLEQDQALMVFPEGVRGISKPFKKRYQLQAFGSGFIRLAMETGSPITPVAVIGAEEQYPSVANLSSLARRLGMPGLPVIPQLFLGMLAPLPVRYRLRFGEPMRFEGDPDGDDEEIEGYARQVRLRIQAMVDEGLSEREHIFW